MDTKGAERSLAWLAAVWAASRAVLLLTVFKVISVAGPDVTSDVSVIYRGWYEVLRQGTFPLDDVTWQYPPAAALAVLSPGLLPFLDYTHAFFVLCCLTDLAVLALLVRYGRKPGRSPRGAWLWTAAVPLLGPTVYARYDVMVTALAVAALLVAARHPRAFGVLTALGALVKVWPALLLTGSFRRRPWASAAVTASGLAALFAVSMPGAFAFLTFQRDRGTEVESLGALVFHVARHFGWEGQVLLNYGSIEFLGPWVGVVSTAALVLTGAAFGWLVLWRLRVVRTDELTLPEAAFTAVLLFTVTSRVISPQYLVWLTGLAAVCLTHRASRMTAPALMVAVASLVTVLEFPLGFIHVVTSDWYGVTLMVVRNGLLVAASLAAARSLWRSTVSPVPLAATPAATDRADESPVSP